MSSRVERKRETKEKRGTRKRVSEFE